MGTYSFETLYEEYSSMLYWVAYGISNNHDTALEITQLAFMKAYENWGVISGLAMAQAKSWLYKTARNAGIDRLRKERREIVTDEIPERPLQQSDQQPEAAALMHEQSETLFLLVQGLPEIYREPVFLHYFAHASQKEAAQLLHITDSTYRSRLSRAKAMLEKQLQKMRKEGYEIDA